MNALRNYILLTINMTEKPKIGIENIQLYIGSFGMTKLLRLEESTVSLIFTAYL